MKKVCFLLITILLLSSCTAGFYDIASSGGYNNPDLSLPVPNRPSGEYYLFDLTFDVTDGSVVKYTVSDHAITDYKAISSTFNEPVPVDRACVVSAYRYTANRVSPILHLTYSMMTTVPDIPVLVDPTDDVAVLRWDELFAKTILWTDTLGGRDLSYHLEFDKDNNGSVDYDINAGNTASHTLSVEDRDALSWNDTMLSVKVSIRDNYGTLIRNGVPLVVNYSHGRSFTTPINCTTLDASKAGNNVFMATAGPDTGNGGKIGIAAILAAPDYTELWNAHISSEISDTVLGVTGAYTDGAGCVFFETASGTIHSVFAIEDASTFGSVSAGFEGSTPLCRAVGTTVYLVYMKETSTSHDIIMRSFQSDGTPLTADTTVDSFSLTDKPVSFSADGSGFALGIEYINGVKLQKTIYYDTGWNETDQFVHNEGNVMTEYMSVLSGTYCGAVWVENSGYRFRRYRRSDGLVYGAVDVALPDVARPAIGAYGDNGFGIAYQAEYAGSDEVYFKSVSEAGSLSAGLRLSGNGAGKSFVRTVGLTDPYVFWIEDTEPVICRVFTNGGV